MESSTVPAIPTTPTTPSSVGASYYNHSVNYNSQHIVYAGWLMKSPPEKRIWKTKWRRRWFVLKLSGQIPGQYVLEYYVDQSCKKLKGVIDLDQCEQVDAGLQLEIRKENYEHMFDIRTAKRVYYLVAKNEDEMNKWVDCICSVCGLKMEAIQNELALLPPTTVVGESASDRYSPQPIQQSEQQSEPQLSTTRQHHQTVLSFPRIGATVATTVNIPPIDDEDTGSEPVSQQPSPPITSSSDSSRSSLATSSSLNYIPISECYTGRSSESQQQFADPPRRPGSPPPRPPKPRSLQSVPKSQSSLALFSQDQSPQPGTTPVPLPALALRKSGPSIKAPPVPSANGYEFVSPQHETRIVSQTLSKPMPPPPAVNRDLKPQRRRNTSEHITLHPFGHPNSRHTLPRPPPSYPTRGDDTRKSFNHHQQFSTLNTRNFQQDKHKFQHYQMHQQHPQHHFLPHHLQHQHQHYPDPELEYIDLDLESESTNSHSPRHPTDSASTGTTTATTTNDCHFVPGSEMSDTASIATNHNNNNNNNLHSVSNLNNDESSTVYKIVDFIKTKAFNDMRMHVDMYRNNEP